MKIYFKKILTAITIIILGILLFTIYKNRIFLISLYHNCNPDHVNLNRDGWKKTFSFITYKNHINVEIYGRLGKEKNTGEFVVVRKGLLPFNLKLTSPKYFDDNIWFCNLKFEKPYLLSFRYRIGYFNPYCNENKQKFVPTIELVIDYNPEDNNYKLFSIRYYNCDEISTIINMPESIGRGEEEEINKIISYQINSNLTSIFPLKECK